MKISQENWIERLGQRGDTQSEALSELRHILIKRLTATFRGDSVVDTSFVEDVVQDTLVKIPGVLEQFEGRSKFTTWATTIAIRMAYTELRRRHWKDVSLNEMIETGGDFLPAADNHESEEYSEQKKKVVETMYRVIQEQLTPRRRDALLAELAGLPLEEIGRRMGSNRNAIYKLTHDARKQLRQGLEAVGFSEADLWALQGN